MCEPDLLSEALTWAVILALVWFATRGVRE